MHKWINLFDLDDTIVNSKHRSEFDENGALNVTHWNANNTLNNILQDHLIYNMTSVLKYFLGRTDCWNVAITSRELDDVDYIFFKTHNIMFNDTLHRGSSHLGNDYCNRYTLPDFELKDILLSNYKFDNEAGFAFDDKQHNLDVFEKHGFKTYNATHINYNEIDYNSVISDAEKGLPK